MTDQPKVLHANGAKFDDVPKEVEAGSLGISTATDSAGNIVVRFSQAVSLVRMPRMQVAQLISALAREANIHVQMEFGK